jgi:AcrR family transcriptional regulator
MTNTATETPREAAKGALLDAAERLLVETGSAGVTTRRLAAEAGVNHGLVHYYFGSVEELLFQAMERFTARLIERQRAMYAADVPFAEKWRTAMGFLEEDLEAGYPKIWAELHAVAWNRPQFQARMAQVHAQWRSVITDAVGRATEELGLDTTGFPLEAWVALVMTLNQGLMLERLIGVQEGHLELQGAIEAWLAAPTKERS